MKNVKKKLHKTHSLNVVFCNKNSTIDFFKKDKSPDNFKNYTIKSDFLTKINSYCKLFIIHEISKIKQCKYG